MFCFGGGLAQAILPRHGREKCRKGFSKSFLKSCDPIALGIFGAFTAVLQHLSLCSVGHPRRKKLVATRFWSHVNCLTPRFLTRCWSCVATGGWGCLEAQHDQKEVTVTFKLSVEFLLPGGERQLGCRGWGCVGFLALFCTIERKKEMAHRERG